MRIMPVWWLGLVGLLIMTYGFPAQADEYLLSPGDKISIQVYGEKELTFSAMSVPYDGIIRFPFIGEIAVTGKSEQELANIITVKLKEGYLLDPQVTVSVVQYRPIFVGGAVENPGLRQFLPNMDVEKIVAMAGGFSERADQKNILVLRSQDNSSEEISAELTTRVLPGDVITVRTIPEDQIVKAKAVVKDYIYLYGEVRRPGRYEYTPDLSVEKAIVLAGGFNTRASKRKISVSRGMPAVISKKLPLDFKVLPGDVITIGASLF